MHCLVQNLLFCNYFKSYPGHTDANFNIAILDGHKEFVAHEKFQQMLHKVSIFLEGHFQNFNHHQRKVILSVLKKIIFPVWKWVSNKSSQPKFHLTYNVREKYSILSVENHTASSILQYLSWTIACLNVRYSLYLWTLLYCTYQTTYLCICIIMCT